MFTLIVLVMVAAFMALQLYRVLGKRTGEERPLARAAEDRVAPVTLPRALDPVPEPRETAGRPIDPRAEAGLRAIIAGEPAFDVARFLEGAQAAYRMVLEAYWAGDTGRLDDLATPEVRDAFAHEVAERTARGETLDNRLVSIERATVVDAQVTGKEARITIRFDADVAAVTRDAAGTVIAGSLSDAVETHDVWTFARTLRSSDPNWKLADTDEA